MLTSHNSSVFKVVRRCVLQKAVRNEAQLLRYSHMLELRRYCHILANRLTKKRIHENPNRRNEQGQNVRTSSSSHSLLSCSGHSQTQVRYARLASEYKKLLKDKRTALRDVREDGPPQNQVLPPSTVQYLKSKFTAQQFSESFPGFILEAEGILRQESNSEDGEEIGDSTQQEVEIKKPFVRRIRRRAMPLPEKTQQGEAQKVQSSSDTHIKSKYQKKSLTKEKSFKLGMPNPTIPVSSVPCPGCGALLHCQDEQKPGYLPYGKFTKINFKLPIPNTICHRCYLLKEHKIASNIEVSVEEYPRIISQIKKTFSLVVVVVDVTDMENSIFPNLLDLIGKKHPIIIVGNKIDLIPRDEKGFSYLRRFQKTLTKAVLEAGLEEAKNKIKHVTLVSAKTGYQIEELITKIGNEWGNSGDIYVVGTTNVGKSTLFNALLMSDLCRAVPRDILQRATTSVWPGTTLKLLKFPMMNFSAYDLHLRVRRLIKSRQAIREMMQDQEDVKREKSDDQKLERLKGDVGITFESEDQKNEEMAEMEDDEVMDTFSFSQRSGEIRPNTLLKKDLSIKEKEKSQMRFKWDHYKESKWVYDTPGVVNPKVINYLSIRELETLKPKRIMLPKTFLLHPLQTLFVSGLARIDYIWGLKYINLTTITNPKLDFHVVDSKDADDFYAKAVESGRFKIPKKDPDRIPSFVGREFNLTGISYKESMADIVLSSVGWVSVTADWDEEIKIRAYTPGGHGLRLRTPPLLPYAVTLKGRRKRGSPTYHNRKPF